MELETGMRGNEIFAQDRLGLVMFPLTYTKLNLKNDVYKNGYRRRRSCTSITAKIHRFVRFVMYCSITTCSVECYWHCSDDTVHYKSHETVNFCGF